VNLRTAFEFTGDIEIITTAFFYVRIMLVEGEKEQMAGLTFIFEISGSKSRHALHCAFPAFLTILEPDTTTLSSYTGNFHTNSTTNHFYSISILHLPFTLFHFFISLPSFPR
jgi:hypothetical protein